VHHDVTQGLRTFRPDVCCDHEWVRPDDPDGLMPKGYEWCSKCNATCIRAPDGSIIEYDDGSYESEDL